jgi:trehalose utilization protein
VRNEAKKALTEKWAKQRGFELEYAVGSLSDLDLLEREVAATDVLINFADSDTDEVHEAYLRGLEKSVAAGKHPLLIHTSGTVVLLDGVNGAKASDRIWDDAEDEDIDSIPKDALHRNIDVGLLNWMEENCGKE